MIRETLQTFFAPGYRVEFLKNCEGVIPALAQWMFEEWRAYDASLTKERLITSFKNRLNDDLYFVHFLNSSSEWGFLQLYEFLRMGVNTLSFEIHYAGVCPIRNLRSKSVQSRVNEILMTFFLGETIGTRLIFSNEPIRKLSCFDF
jgi:hypothetical protein